MSAIVSGLLPNNRTPFEVALSEGMTDVLPVPVREIVDGSAAPPAFLPFLAAHESVDLWFTDWPEARKRLMIREAMRLAAMKGTPRAAHEFLAFVDAVLLDRVSFPRPFVMGRGRIGRTPIGHPAFAARHLVKVVTHSPPRAFKMARGGLGRMALRTPSREKIRRASAALAVSKAPETEYRVDFAHKRHLLLSDSITLEGGFRLGQYLSRKRL